MIQHGFRNRLVVTAVGVVLNAATFMLPSTAYSTPCDPGPTYWGCVSWRTQCEFEEECWEYYCSNDEWTGRINHRTIHLNC